MSVETAVSEGVLALRRAETRWLSSGWDGGFWESSVAYNVSVPESFDRRDLDAYRTARLERAGFAPTGPALFTGVDMEHARAAQSGPVLAVATVGLSNPAQLPLHPTGETEAETDQPPTGTGTVNVLLGTTVPLDRGGLTGLLATVVEAKTATLLGLTGFPGTTTDAVVVGAAHGGGESAGRNAASGQFAGSATPVGAAARAAVRAAVRASFEARYAETDPPATVADAEYGVSTERRATVFHP